ncbi:MAG: cytochrome c [Pseudomonadota bacterium]
MKKFLIAAAVVLLSLSWWLFAEPGVADLELPETADAVARGEYLVAAGGCISCHAGSEDPQALSGGMALESDFGTFFAPNITPDLETGIGSWTAREFLLAMKHGRTPEGSFYFPAFPYTSYAGMTDTDVLAMAAYLMAQPAVASTAPEHELPGWLFRWAIAGWNRLAALTNPEPPAPAEADIARGAYLARHLGHCGECHTPRNALGIVDLSREFGGGVLPGGKVEAIDAAALEDWTEDSFALLLTLGLKPSGEFVGGKMEPVIEHNTSRLTAEDRKAMAAFFIRGQTP